MKKLRQTNRQDMVFIRPPGISDGAFQLRMGNIWFCKILLLFKISTMMDTGMQQQECVYVCVLEEYNGPKRAGHVMHIMHTTHVLMGFVSQFSLGGLISILNHLQAQGTSTNVVCHSSQLHTGTSSSCPSGWEREDTLWHAKRIIRLSWSFLWQKSEQWQWMYVVVLQQLDPWMGTKQKWE